MEARIRCVLAVEVSLPPALLLRRRPPLPHPLLPRGRRPRRRPLLLLSLLRLSHLVALLLVFSVLMPSPFPSTQLFLFFCVAVVLWNVLFLFSVFLFSGI
ncbi:hypothetical protein GW17_00049191 [Ensete ventricosum]|nr:hypothetical protein GW17_00049191 [Ensete ventricosum]